MMAARIAAAMPVLTHLLEGLAGPGSVPALPVAGLALDSRQVVAGTVFVALKGTRGHGIEHVAEAARNGAVAVVAEPDSSWDAARLEQAAASAGLPLVVVDGLAAVLSRVAARFYGEPVRDLRILGVTGTNGKSSVTHFVAQALPEKWHCGVIGTLGYGFPERLTEASHTTPDAIRLQAELAALRTSGARAVAMEVSSHALHQHRLAAVPVHTAVFTNLSRDHLDYHGDMESYAEVKAGLFRAATLTNAVLNLGDPMGRRLAAELAGGTAGLVGYGLDIATDLTPRWVTGSDLVPTAEGLELNIRSNWGEGHLRSRLLGRFNAENLLAALAVLLLWEVPLEQALQRLESVAAVPGRMQLLGGGALPTVVIDYAHTPDALEKALHSLRSHCRQRLAVVFGCGGDRDRGKRPEMGRIAEAEADLVVVTDDNPRHEDGARIVAEILAGISLPQQVQVTRDRARAIRWTVAQLVPGDVLLVAGKGHETYQQIGDLRQPFSDLAQVQAALAEWRA